MVSGDASEGRGVYSLEECISLKRVLRKDVNGRQIDEGVLGECMSPNSRGDKIEIAKDIEGMRHNDRSNCNGLE